MTRLPAFLESLGVGIDADERTIRRAYAKRLRAIDQAAEPHSFQRLRQAFERALHWHAAHARAASSGEPAQAVDVATEPIAAPEPAPAHDPGEPAAPEPTPAMQAESVFAAFTAELASATDETAATSRLHAALHDGRLAGLDARATFEYLVARSLASGWRPGHEWLLVPAIVTFEWEIERRRLLSFDAVGRVIDAAITERHVFLEQPAAAVERDLASLRRLQDDTPPTERELRTLVTRFLWLQRRHPRLVHMLASRAALDAWERRWRGLPPDRDVFIPPRPGTDRGERNVRLGLIALAFVLGLLVLGLAVTDRTPGAHAATTEAAELDRRQHEIDKVLAEVRTEMSTAPASAPLTRPETPASVPTFELPVQVGHGGIGTTGPAALPTLGDEPR